MSDISEKLSIRYRLTHDLPLGTVRELYLQAGWIEPDADVSYFPAMLANSFQIAAAFTEDGRLVGMMRALSDGVSDAYLLDLIVHKDFRRQGIGRHLLNLLQDDLKSRGVDWIVLTGAPGTETFYQKTPSCSGMTGYTPYRFS